RDGVDREPCARHRHCGGERRVCFPPRAMTLLPPSRLKEVKKKKKIPTSTISPPYPDGNVPGGGHVQQGSACVAGDVAARPGRGIALRTNANAGVSRDILDRPADWRQRILQPDRSCRTVCPR